MRSILASLALMGMLAQSPASAGDANIDQMVASLLEAREIGRALDDATEEDFARALLQAAEAADRLIKEHNNLLQQLLDYKVAEIRSNGACIPAQAFDASPSGLPADLRCPD